MHNIHAYERWNQYYNSSHDDRSPFAGKEYNYDLYSDNVYGYYIRSCIGFFRVIKTLYRKIIYAYYALDFAAIEMIG